MNVLPAISQNLTLLLMAFALQMAYAQESAPPASAKGYDLHLEIGIKYVPNLGGISLGLSFYNPAKPLAFNLRNDFLLSVGRPDDVIGIPQSIPNQLQPFTLTDFHTQTYLEAEYRVLQKKNKPMFVHAGYGWVYNGIHKNLLLNAERGYSVITTVISYKPSWVVIELRGDIPIKSGYFSRKNGTTNKVFPVSMGLKYRFKPRKNE